MKQPPRARHLLSGPAIPRTPEGCAEAYEEIAVIASDRVVVIDATGTVEEVHERVMKAVQERLP